MRRRQFLHWGMYTSIAAFLNSGRTAALPPTGKSVVVVGGGMAGISAARLLHDQGYETTLIEARPRLGGRIHTRRDMGVAVDMGAGWIHGRTNNPLTPLAEKYGSEIRLSDFNNIHAFFADGRPVPRERLFGLYERVLHAVANPPAGSASVSLGNHIRESVSEVIQSNDDEHLLNGILGGMMLEVGGELDFIDLAESNAGKSFEGGDYRFVNGYDSIVYGLARGLTVYTGTPIKRIAALASGVEIETIHGVHRADYSIVTVPLGVLKRDSIAFEPGLPNDIQESIREIRVGLSEKVILKFPEAFWPKDATILIRGTENQSHYPIFFNNHLPFTGDPILTVRVAGNRVPEFNKLSDAEALEEVMPVLRKAFGKSVPNPTQILRSRWAVDPNSAGAYSTFDLGVPSMELRRRFTRPLQKRLFLAGEHTHPEYSSTVHGAHLSGVRAAEQVLQS